MRGLVTAGRVVRVERASLSTKANVASRGWLFIGFRVDPVPRAWFRIQPAGKDIVGDLVRGAAPGDDGGVVRRGLRAGLLTCPMVGLPAAVEAAGSRAAVGRRGSDRVSDP